jgi:hypothetical protein
MKYPPHNPDLEPCDSVLFGSIKEKLTDIVFSDEEELSVAIRGIMTVTPWNCFAECLFSVGETTKRIAF